MKVKWLSILTFILYLIQVLALYIMSSFLTFINMAHDPSSADILILVAFILLSITLIIINIVIAFLGLKRSNSSETKNPLGRIMGFKLLLTPFFIGHAYWFLVALGGILNPFLYLLCFVIPFIFVAYAYAVLLASSSYLIVEIIKMRKKGVLTNGKCALHIILQLMFFTDVVDSIYLFFKYRKIAEKK